jgi:hypothetical protein
MRYLFNRRGDKMTWYIASINRGKTELVEAELEQLGIEYHWMGQRNYIRLRLPDERLPQIRWLHGIREIIEAAEDTQQ